MKKDSAFTGIKDDYGEPRKTTPGNKPGFFYGYIIVVATFLIIFAMYATYYAFGVFFKPLLNEFGWTRAVTSGAFSLSSIVQGFMGIAMGWLTDRFGPRIVITICGLLLGLGYVLMSQIDVVWQLYLFYGILIGAGMGGSFIPLLSTIARWFYERRSMMSGIVTAGIGMGAMFGPPVTRWLISTYHWRVSSIILGVAVFIIIVLSAQLIKSDPSEVGQVAYGRNRSEEAPLNQEAEGLSLREAFFTRQFWIVFGMFFCFGYCVFGMMVHMAPHTIDLGFSAASAASILAVIGAFSIAGKVLLGKVGDIIGNRKVFIIGFSLISAVLFCLVPSKTMWILYFLAGVFGFSYGGNAASESPIVAFLFGLKSLGLILGIICFGFTLGGAVGAWLTGYMFDVTDSYRLGFIIGGAISFSGLILTLILKTKPKSIDDQLRPIP